MRQYVPGDILVSSKLGVITVLETLEHHQVKCRVYDKQKVSDSINIFSSWHLDMMLDIKAYNLHPVKV
jgi:hypothetical protein